MTSPPFQDPWPRWLKIKKAAEYSGAGQKRLKQLAKDGWITGFADPDSKRGDWIFDKHSLDEYRERQAAQSQGNRVEVVDILKSFDLS